MSDGTPLYVFASRCFGPAYTDGIVAHMVQHSGRWQRAKVTVDGATGDARPDGVRSGWVLPDELLPAHVRAEFVPWLLGVVPAALKRLGLEPIAVPAVEVQMTAYHHRGGYMRHTDSGSEEPGHFHNYRRLTFVYYAWERPRPFKGGELAFPDHRLVVEPANDSLVCFDSSLPHEVRPVFTSRSDPASCRFAITGWVGEGAST